MNIMKGALSSNGQSPNGRERGCGGAL